MAEVAAAAWAVEEAITTTVQVGVGAYMVSKPTMPLHATFTQIATSSDDETKLSLCRSGHSLTVVGNKAYIFGGQTAANKLASTDVHAITLTSDKSSPDYSVIPAIADTGSTHIPSPRQKHAACSFNICVAVFGGVDESGEVIDEQHIWLFNTAKPAWETLQPKDTSAPAPSSRNEAQLFNHQNNLVLFGGRSKTGETLKDVWLFNYVHSSWSQLADAPVFSSSAAVINGMLHVIANGDKMGSDLLLLELPPKDKPLAEVEQKSWHTVPFPTNPLTPGPQPRVGAGLIPVSTGHGRNYLLYLFGAHPPPSNTDTTKEAIPSGGEQLYHSDIWTYQLPSTAHSAKLTTTISEAIKPAKIKDSIRSALGYDTGGHSWAETEVLLPPADLDAPQGGSSGKVHPGPRGFFGCDVMEDGKGIVVWGGINAKGEREGDGWVIGLS
ncbi:hypothetical protein LTR78_005555 [Recurvomyces mirabilis]|uniref:Galactose oxidase n=1 Tax=Recurvomyces mirabilis TaxID=574656 RepID=A0AAE0WML6_9PEZI|nr:hypothetical protein LTR78_005555 [Recurvomyces mirabilis]KAK5151325.1 hypothetical protein LTS14_009495 [Recurvomyces mirabilis]